MSDTIGLPSLTISFEYAAEQVISRTKNSVVAIIVRDATIEKVSALYVRSEANIPDTLSQDNINYISRTFLPSNRGSTPSAYLILAPVSTDPLDDAEFDLALAALELIDADYVVPPLGATSANVDTLTAWILAQRKKYRCYKAVLAKTTLHDIAFINVNMDGCVTKDGTLNSADMLPRIAGLLAGLPLTSSVTSCILPEIITCTAIADIDTAINRGELVLVSDGRSVKVARGVNSLGAELGDKSPSWRKIKIVEAMDLITYFARTTFENACGRYPNTFAQKQVLISLLLGYFRELEASEILDAGSTCSIDFDAQTEYLREQGFDVDNMTDDEILTANTGTWVFISSSVSMLDAMEDFALVIATN